MPELDPQLDLDAPDVAEDPYPLFAHLRGCGDAVDHPQAGGWLVARDAAVRRLLVDPRLDASFDGSFLEPLRSHLGNDLDRLVDHLKSWPVFSDGVEHDRQRQALLRPLSARATAKHEPLIREFARRGADSLPTTGDVDLHKGFCLPFASAVAGHVLGLPDETIEGAARDARLILACVDAGPDPAVAQAALPALNRFEALVEAMAAGRVVAHPGSAIDSLLESERSGALERRATVAAVVQILTGGVDPLATTIGLTVAALLSTDAGLARAVARCDVERSVEEALRLDCPFHAAPRVATAPIELDNATIAPRNRVVLLLAAANRDPDFAGDEPDAFDPDRRVARHVAFGLGSHYCLGAALARLATATAVRELAGAQPLMRTASRPKLRPVVGSRTIERFTVHVG